ncbi:AraC family transcriptional regulator [Martelella sp. HB161492]|uniref:helix-turn-helix domain-containing protein n=1 Tax=Martelella sp. HB161492 TaxID=2720726 RepID=UPI0015915182|nr:AraC family transcriptional regulator [Martelella sp. HB161492]
MLQNLASATAPHQGKTIDSFGCPFSQLSTNQSLRGGDISFFRKSAEDEHLSQVATDASNRGFAIGVSMASGHRRRIFHAHHAASFVFPQDGLYIRNLADPYKADLAGPFDFLLLEISPAALQNIAQESDLATVTELQLKTAETDTVLASLVKAMAPAIENPGESSKLFVDQLATAIGTHIVQRYGGATRRAAPGRKLSRAHEVLAKNLLSENLHGDISVLEVARACNLSRGYFIHAFRETTGMTPYQWLLNARVSRACELLRSSTLSLAEIALACGFSDQSHFTRVFTRATGATPGLWRRTA